MAVSLFTITPIELYKFCVSLQNTFAKDLVTIAAGEQYVSLGSLATKVLVSSFNPGGTMISAGLFELVTLIALGFCVFKIFFDNIKRGGILLIQLAVGSLYLFSIPRGYGDGFNNWVKQVFALCLTLTLVSKPNCCAILGTSAALIIIPIASSIFVLHESKPRNRSVVCKKAVKHNANTCFTQLLNPSP